MMKKTMKYIACVLFAILGGFQVYYLVRNLSNGMAFVETIPQMLLALGLLMIALGALIDKKWLHVVGAVLCVLDGGYNSFANSSFLFSNNLFNIFEYLDTHFIVTWLSSMIASYLLMFYYIFVLIEGIVKRSRASKTFGIIAGCIAFVVLIVYIVETAVFDIYSPWHVWLNDVIRVAAPIILGIYYCVSENKVEVLNSEPAVINNVIETVAEESSEVKEDTVNTCDQISNSDNDNTVKEDIEHKEETSVGYVYNPEAGGTFTYVKDESPVVGVEIPGNVTREEAVKEAEPEVTTRPLETPVIDDKREMPKPAPKLSTDEYVRELKKLKELLDLGIITREELEKKKAQLQ